MMSNEFVTGEAMRRAGSNPQPLAPEANGMLGSKTLVAVLLPK